MNVQPESANVDWWPCSGQVELYSHLPVMHNIARALDSWGYRSVGVYLLDALFVLEPAKFISGCMLSLSCMLQLGRFMLHKLDCEMIYLPFLMFQNCRILM
jgi:hypothetical protein